MKIKIIVKLNSSKDLIKKNSETEWVVFTTKSPVDNKANKSIIELVAKEIGVAKSRVSIVKGAKNREKILEIGL